jgi:hypothetical protein
MQQQDRRMRTAGAAIAWAMLFYALSQVALNVYIDGWHPELYDAEFGARMVRLRTQLRENPGRPLLLVIGSSRMTMNFLPEQLAPLYTPSGERVVVFNFAHLGAGPAANLLQVRRLLRYGIRPDWLIVEVMPPQLNDSNQRIVDRIAEIRDEPLVAHYKNPVLSWALFLRGRTAPCYKQRAFLIHRALPEWAPDARPEQDTIQLGPLGGDYEWQAVPVQDTRTTAFRTEVARCGYLEPLQGDFKVADISNRATHDLLDLCRHEHIQVVLLLSPEGPLFQSWYSPRNRQVIDAYCKAVSQEYAVPLIDARDWLEEGDFVDSHHVYLKGARRFTQRFSSEVLRPLVAGGRP